MGGGRFQPLRARFVEQIRREWWTAHDYDAAASYANVLNGAGRYDATVTLFEAMLTGEKVREYQNGIEFLAPKVARAMVAVGRRADAMAMLDRVSALIPAEGEAQRLNLSGAVLTQLYETQQWTALVPKADAWIAEAERLGAGVNSSATLQVQTLRVCALERLGRKDDAVLMAAVIESNAKVLPGAMLNVYGCRGERGRGQGADPVCAGAARSSRRHADDAAAEHARSGGAGDASRDTSVHRATTARRGGQGGGQSSRTFAALCHAQGLARRL